MANRGRGERQARIKKKSPQEFKDSRGNKKENIISINHADHSEAWIGVYNKKKPRKTIYRFVLDLFDLYSLEEI